MYGTEGVDGSFGANCLLARRLAERGVRFIQLYHRDWDHHGAIKEHVKGTAAEVDQGAAALIKDLKAARHARRDAGDLGRRVRPDARWPRATAATTTSRASRSGWPAAASRRESPTAQTDEFGYSAVHDVVHVHDLHATILALFGIDHLRLVYRFQGRDFRLTDVAGQVVKTILA